MLFLSVSCSFLFMLASFQAGLALKMAKASQQTQLNSVVNHPELPLANGSCHSSGITSDWTKLGHLMFPESITEATGLENSDFLTLRTCPWEMGILQTHRKGELQALMCTCP